MFTYFTNGDTNKFSSNVCKQCICQSSPETKEDGGGFVLDLVEEIMTHRTIGRSPVAESNPVVLWVTTKVDDDTHQEETDQGDNYGACQQYYLQRSSID